MGEQPPDYNPHEAKEQEEADKEARKLLIREKFMKGNRWEIPTGPDVGVEDLLLLPDAAADEVEHRLSQDPRWENKDPENPRYGASESISNGMLHGNYGLEKTKDGEKWDDALRRLYKEYRESGREPGKKLLALIDLSPSEFKFAVQDEGKGFKREDVPDPTAPENLLKQTGRGIYTLESMFDNVEFSSGGREIILTVKRDSLEDKVDDD